MPRVPAYDNFQTVPGASAARGFDAPTVRNVAAEQAQEAGRGLMQFGGALAKVQREKQDEADQLRVLEAEDQLERARLRFLYHPEEGAYARKGADALNAGDRPLPQLYGEQFDKAVSELTDKLGNDRQKAAFRIAAQRRATQFRGDLTKHVAREFERHRVGVLTSAAETAAEAAAAEWGDVDRVAEHAARARFAAGQLALAQGMSGNEGKALERAAVSKVHTAVIANALAAKKNDYAQEYFKQHSGELEADARLRLTQALERGAKDEQVFGHVDRIMGKHAGNLSAALRESRSSVPADLRGDVEARLRQYEADRRAARAEGEKNATDRAWGLVYDGTSPENFPPGLRGALDGRALASMRDYLENRAHAIEQRAKNAFTPDTPLYGNLLNLSATNPEQFMNMNLAQHEPRLGPQLTRSLQDKQSKLLAGDAEAKQMGAVLKRAMDIAGPELNAIGMKTSGVLDKQQAAEVAQFQNSLWMAVDDRQMTLNRALTDVELRETVMRQLDTFVRQGSGFGLMGNRVGEEERRAYQIPPGEGGQFIKRPYEDIPQATRVAIETALRQAQPSGDIAPEDVERMYLNGVLTGEIDDATGLVR